MNHGVKSCTPLIGRNAMIFVTGGKGGGGGWGKREREEGREGKGGTSAGLPIFLLREKWC